LLLNRRTGFTPIGAKYAAIAVYWFEELTAALAFIEIQAGVCRHALYGCIATIGAN